MTHIHFIIHYCIVGHWTHSKRLAAEPIVWNEIKEQFLTYWKWLLNWSARISLVGYYLCEILKQAHRGFDCNSASIKYRFFPNRNSPYITAISRFHDWLFIFLIAIAVIIFGTLTIVMHGTKGFRHRACTDSQSTEFWWAVLPCFVLIRITIPSLGLLYTREGLHSSGIAVKVMGHQWYWQYDCPNNPNFDSYIVDRVYRVLDTDNRLAIPCKMGVQILISAADVLHSWTLPTIGIKADAIPGRVNSLSFRPLRPGIFFGQCREICGRNHRFIPINLECYTFNSFLILKIINITS